MEKVFLLIVIILFILAISDLIVGVANDAVNFLNSAIGSRVAPLAVILLIASAGVVAGTMFSNGMMEVARKGIFNPASFTFYNIMIIFIAVMITDILLLDIYNTFGLPTSTTVSLVFELLGAAVAISLVTIIGKGQSMGEMVNYINTGKALAIITGILISVVIAFTVGTIVQYLSRLLFTFNIKRTLRYFGSVWGGLALTFILYFIVIKGIKDATFISPADVEWVLTHTWPIIGISFLSLTIILQILHWFFKVNVLKIIVMAGTFALALSFAGNDLVNFIGVPLAGFESFRIFSAAAGASADSFMMDQLAGEVKTPTMFLLISGLIMVITLFLSKKSRAVTKTEVSLGSQDVIDERFASSLLARSLVRQTLRANKVLTMIIPRSVQKGIQKRFNQKPYKNYLKKNPGVSFDLIRASVNLVVSSILISFATSLKLPLSTTYVTFMVAMGSSFADGAWGRESAVYRITGVITVIGGWFFTALSAFTVSLIIALVLYWTQLWGLLVLLPLAIFLIVKTHIFFNKKTSEENKQNERRGLLAFDNESIYERTALSVTSILVAAVENIKNITDYLIHEKRKKLKDELKTARRLSEETKLLKKEIPVTLQSLREESFESGHNYIEIIDFLRESMHCVTHIALPVYEHVDNNHAPLTEFQANTLKDITNSLHDYVNDVVAAATTSDYSHQSRTISTSQAINEMTTKARKRQLKILKKDQGSTRANMLFMDILNELKNFVLLSNNIYKAFRDFSENNLKTSVNIMTAVEE